MSDTLETTLCLIVDPDTRNLAREILRKAPSYFWTMIRSEKKPCHMLEDTRQGDLCLHSKKVAQLAFRVFQYLGYDSDIGVVAGLLHHVSEKGYYDEGNHPLGAFDKLHYILIHLDKRGYGNMEYTLEEGTHEHKEFIAKWSLILQCIRWQEWQWGKTRSKALEQVVARGFGLPDISPEARAFQAVNLATICNINDHCRRSLIQLHLGRRPGK